MRLSWDRERENKKKKKNPDASYRRDAIKIGN